MKKLFLTFVVLTIALQASVAQTVVRPSVKSKTTFAIVVDEASYQAAKSEIEAYRSAIENEGLGTYLLVDDWKRPDEIREELIKLHADKKAPLEGCVLVGDVPIPMIRDAQHLCSAFKMNQDRYAWHRSSVPSDRYYDDFGLKFDYLKQDTVPARSAYHYYSLRADSRHYLSPDIYSGRIRPLDVAGLDKHQQLRDYLKKVVAQKQSEANNVIDRLSVARGHGYNSEDIVAWAGEHLALREQMPQLFQPGNVVKFYDFTIVEVPKHLYLNEVQQKELDIMLFHHHGGVTAQYFSGYPKVDGVQPSIENIKRFLRSKLPDAAKKMGREAAVAEYAKRYDVPASWCEEAFDAEKMAIDSAFTYHMDAHTDDIRQITPNARFVMFDACYNGSFHQKDYLAGSYIFNPGKTIATQGSSVNTIQDKWPDEFLGLLMAGMRVGHFNRMNCFLETHIVGDPTLRFANSSGMKEDINHLLTLRAGDAAYWKKQLNHEMPDMQALALRQLSDANYAGLPALLKESYFQSPYFVVRLEAMRLLALNYPEQATEVIEAAVNDGYELIRRFAGEYVMKNGSETLMPVWVDAYLNRNQEKRLRFKIVGGLKTFDADKAIEEVNRQASAGIFYNKEHIDLLLRQLSGSKKSLAADIAEMHDPNAKKNYVRGDITAFRNLPVKAGIEPIMKFLKDESKPTDLRVVAAEALGWYYMYHDKASIVEQLQTVSSDNEAIMNEVKKSINRLQSKNR